MNNNYYKYIYIYVYIIMTTLIFGDSFIGPFNLLDNKNLRIYKFKGKTMKGIGKKEDKDRKK